MSQEEEKELTPAEKLKKYEELFEEMMMQGVHSEGIVLLGPENGFYKISSDSKELIASSPLIPLKKGDHVMITNGVVTQLLPEGLITVEEEQVEFDHLDWSAIGGIKSQVERIKSTVENPIKYKQYYEELNLRPSKGILLYGPPGCGKTMVAKAIASSMLKDYKIDANLFVYIKGAELLSKYVGVTEGRIKNIFDSARKTLKKTNIRPVVFIDEAEALLPARGSRKSSDIETTIVPTFLSEMDGFEGNNPFIILATNFKDTIDSAIRRPGRIDLNVFLDRPTFEDSIDIFRIHLGKTVLASDVNIETLSKDAVEIIFSNRTLKDNVSGAMIEGLVMHSIENALLRKIKDPSSKSGVNHEDLLKALNEQE